ncbi:hypothetical protein [Actinoplanes sp. HUAS TT8]|uniref:hypothetical protein n=1 Tax=Actinoplanes sp. HUAS TT8 TaxID=3447453 RepID=UPI003F5264C8
MRRWIAAVLSGLALAAGMPAAAYAEDTPPAAAACGGALAFGTPIACDSISGSRRDRYTITTTVPGERVMTQLYATSTGGSLQAVLNSGDGTCLFGSYSDECTVAVPGTYPIDVSLYNGAGSGSYAIGVQSRDNPAACTTLDPATFVVDGDRLPRALAAGAPGDCYRFAGSAGMGLRVETTATSRVDTRSADVRGKVWSPSGDPVCSIQFDTGTCALTEDGVYTFFLADIYGGPLDYTLRLVRTDRPVGCPTLKQGGYGTPAADQIGDASLGSYSYTCFAVHLSAGAKTVRTSDGGQVHWELSDTSGTVCTEAGEYYGEQCRLPAEGDYTLWLRNPDWTYEPYKFQASVIDLAGSAGCRPSTGTDWDGPAVSLTAATPIEMYCQPFTAAPGDRVVAYTSGGGASWISDGTGTRICAPDESGPAGCVLPGTGPYRVIGQQNDLRNVDLQIRRLSGPSGCPVVTPGAYGTAPAGAYAANRCRVLDVPAAGKYLVRPVDDTNNEQWAEIYTAAGTKVCDTGSFCDFPAAGRYTMVIGGSGVRDGAYATVFTAPGGAGCVPVTVQGLATGAVRGSFTALGETDCLEVDAPAGARIGVLTPPKASGVARPDWKVIDAAGNSLCASDSSRDCELTGAAPYRLLLNAPKDKVTGDYAVAVQRLDQITGCGSLPQGAFGNTVGVTTTFSSSRFAACWSIPADQHATTELVSFAPVSGTGAATLSVRDSAGVQVCGIRDYTSTQSLNCTFEPGQAYTVVMTAAASSFQYRITRKDVTIAGATCQTPSNTALGGPAMTGTMTAPDDLRCYRVIAAETDDYWLGVRSAGGAARYWIYDASGADRCSGYVVPCRVSGSTAYLVIVWPTKTGSIPYAVDSWHLAADGRPVAQCPAASAVPGFSLTGTLDDRTTAGCVAVPITGGSRYLGAIVTNTEGGSARPEPYFFTTGGTGTGLTACDLGGPERLCGVRLASSGTGTGLFVVTPTGVGGTYPYQVRTTCPYKTCPNPPAYTLTSVTPSSAPNSGPVTLTLRGSTLTTGDTVRLARTGSAAVSATIQSVDNGILTATADLTGITPGAWDVTVTSGADGRAATLTGGLTVTAAPLTLVKAPAISGTVRVGSTVKATTGTWTPAATAYTYQWTANGATIKGATASAYVIPATLRGKRLAVTVTAKRADRANSAATSAGVLVGYGVAPRATTAPKISGTVKAGRKVKVSAGAWTPRPEAYRYQWLLNGKAIKGATGSSLTISRAWAGKKLSVQVTVKKTGYYDGKKASGGVTIER